MPFTFSMMKNYVDRDGQISSYPVDELYSSLKSEKAKKKLESEIRYLYGRVTGRILDVNAIVQREYEL